jgi:hypothetical protein
MTAQPSASAMPTNMNVRILPNMPGIAAHGDDAAGRGDADADGRAAKGETDVDVAGQLFLRAS